SAVRPSNSRSSNVKQYKADNSVTINGPHRVLCVSQPRRRLDSEKLLVYSRPSTTTKSTAALAFLFTGGSGRDEEYNNCFVYFPQIAFTNL
ncbi:hypothetical protein J6590_088325, partial [Homalodisca vitripennis]